MRMPLNEGFGLQRTIGSKHLLLAVYNRISVGFRFNLTCAVASYIDASLLCESIKYHVRLRKRPLDRNTINGSIFRRADIRVHRSEGPP